MKKRKLFNNVKKLECIICNKDFDLNSSGFMTINSQGWGYCKDCYIKVRVAEEMKKDGYDPHCFIMEHILNIKTA